VSSGGHFERRGHGRGRFGKAGKGRARVAMLQRNETDNHAHRHRVQERKMLNRPFCCWAEIFLYSKEQLSSLKQACLLLWNTDPATFTFIHVIFATQKVLEASLSQPEGCVPLSTRSAASDLTAAGRLQFVKKSRFRPSIKLQPHCVSAVRSCDSLLLEGLVG